MAQKTKTREISIVAESGSFDVLFKRFNKGKDKYDFEGLALLRKLLSNEKAKMLHVLKNKKPKSLYDLAKILGRDFKAVSDDLKVLERFGFIELIEEKTGGRRRLRPVLAVDSMNINIKI